MTMEHIKTYLLIFSIVICFRNTYAQEVEFKTENIKFSSKGVEISGTMYSPSHPIGALIVVHGSGQEKRMSEFAATLAKNAFCVFTYDKRGVGESEGIYAGPEVGTNNVDSTNLNLLADDVSAAVDVMAKSLSDSTLKIGLIGGSQAGWVIPIAAYRNQRVDFIVIFSGALVTALEQLRFQFFTEGKSSFWENYSEKEVREHIKNAPDRFDFVDTDPVKTLDKLSIPGLWIFGGKDIQVPVGLSIENLEKLRERNKTYDYILFPKLGHNTFFSRDTEPLEKSLSWIKENL